MFSYICDYIKDATIFTALEKSDSWNFLQYKVGMAN